jgi:hypothetical protein
MTNLEKVDSYKIKVKEALAKNPQMIIGFLTEDEESHVRDIAFSIIMAREEIFTAGGFANAILANDLEDTIGRADNTCLRALKFFVYVNRYL